MWPGYIGRYYNPDVHAASFILPEFAARELRKSSVMGAGTLNLQRLILGTVGLPLAARPPSRLAADRRGSA